MVTFKSDMEIGTERPSKLMRPKMEAQAVQVINDLDLYGSYTILQIQIFKL